MSGNFDPSEPRRRRPPASALSHFAIVEREGPDPMNTPAFDPRLVRRCKCCGVEELNMILHQDPDDEGNPYRTVCGKCQGEANLRRMGVTRSER